MHLESAAKTLQTVYLAISIQERAGGSMHRQDLRFGSRKDALRVDTVLAAAVILACLAGTAQAAVDVAKGKAAFVRQCSICHTDDKGGENRFGPNLFGIIGKKAGTAKDYAYTNAFKNRANWEW